MGKKSNMGERMMQWNDVIHKLFRPRCPMCDEIMKPDEVSVCEECASECPHLEVVEKIKGDGDD
ncbi:hypothetical protein Q4R16_13025 [Morganella morganii]